MKRTWTDIDLIEAVKNNTTICGVLRDLGLKPQGSNYKTIKNVFHQLGIDTSHFNQDYSNNLRRARECRKQPTKEELFVSNGLYKDTKHIKRYILKYKLLDYECSICKLTHWLDSPLSLHIDHINGVSTDNRIENLRFLCPNCHSLTDTYCGKNNKKMPLNFCKCGSKILKASLHCAKCSRKNQYKINWVDTEKLIELVLQHGFVQTGKIVGVTDNAVRKHLRAIGIDPKSIKKSSKL
jgi:5-methylcytosine-specific restriction endonuclease McrA